MTDEAKRGRGRPPKGRPLLIRLNPEQIEWLDRQGKRPDVIRALIDKAMKP